MSATAEDVSTGSAPDVLATALQDLGTGLAPDVEASAVPLHELRDVAALTLTFSQEPAGGGAATEDSPEKSQEESPEESPEEPGDETRYVLGPGAEELLAALAASGTTVDPFLELERARATGAAGEVVEVPLPDQDAPRLLLVGLGADAPADHRRAGAGLARRLRGVESVVTAAAGDDTRTTAFVEGLVLGSFTFSLRTTAPEPPVRRVVIAGLPEEAHSAVRRGVVLGLAGWRSRTLALAPSNLKGPSWLADQATALATASGIDVEVWDEQRLAQEGWGGLLGVGQASDRPPRLVRLGYTPPDAGPHTPHVVLVGKGITFDTGGLSLKPADGMMTMKRDMTGAGVVLAVLGALAEVGSTARVTGLMACAENAVSGRSLRPGDVLRHYGGRTSEVTNTDAEGRLVLADALAYAAAVLEPTALVDVATLTGASKVALGQRTGALFANDDALAGALLDAAGAAGEPLWRMPLSAEYEELLESAVADGDNAAGGPGAITAALFLQHFTGGLPWAHLDIASVGDSPVDAHEWSSGATGFGARALVHWLSTAGPGDQPAGLPATAPRRNP